MLEIGFILPPSTNAKPFRQVPLTSLYLLTILEQKYGDKISVCEIDLRGVKEDDMRFYIPEKDVYLYTVMSPEWGDVKTVHSLVKSLYPKGKHIAGGVHAFLFQEECLGYLILFLLVEGEITATEIVDDLLNNRELKKRYICPDSTLINPNDYPFPSRKFLPRPAIAQTGLLVGSHRDLLTSDAIFSRWCPFRCAFCVNITFGKTRFRNPLLIEEEIEYLKKEYGIKALVLKDDNGIPAQKQIAPPFLEAIARTGVKWEVNHVPMVLVKRWLN